MQKSDGMNYAPQGKPSKVVQKGEFTFAAIALDHGHIYGMCNGLLEAGAELKWVYDPDPQKVQAFQEKFPMVKVASREQDILEDNAVQLVACAAVTSERCSLGLKVMDHGKDYFTDKAPFTTFKQLAAAREKVKQTGKKYAVYYSERLHVESAVFAGCKDAQVVHSKVANYHNKDYPELEDFGEATLVGDNGATNYFRVDWFTPGGLGTWGDGRAVIMGTEGYIELRKYIDIARDSSGDHVYLVNGQKEQHYEMNGQIGFPFFGELILDCINRTEQAMTQEHTFKAAELCLQAQEMAIKVEGSDVTAIQHVIE